VFPFVLSSPDANIQLGGGVDLMRQQISQQNTLSKLSGQKSNTLPGMKVEQLLID